MPTKIPSTNDPISAYIAGFPEPVQILLKQMRAVIRQAAPEATEKISYGMPTYYFRGNLVHFAAHKNHIGFYPVPSGIEAFKEELSHYKGAKGSVQFPLDQQLPIALIHKIVKYRLAENIKKSKEKKWA